MCTILSAFYKNVFRWRSRHQTITNTNTCDLPSVFWAKCIGVYDGDTFQIAVKFRGEWTKYSCRSFGWDAPEMKPRKAGRTEVSLTKEKQAAVLAKAWLCSWWEKQEYVSIIHFKGYDKYGRVLAEIPGLMHEFMKTGLITQYQGDTKVLFDVWYKTNP